MVNWEFFDDQTPESLRELLDGCLAGTPPAPTRGPSTLCTFKQASRVLAGFPDGRAFEGVQAGPATLAGLELAKQRGDDAPPMHGAATSSDSTPVAGAAGSTVTSTQRKDS
jgi:NADH-quinone oxidoreductase subunit E